MSLPTSPDPTRRATADAMIGRTLGGRYRIVDLLAPGTGSRVYLAVDDARGTLVAVKVAPPTNLRGPDPVQIRLLREVRVARLVQHPNIVRVLDQGTAADSSFFLVMELIAGRNLYQVIQTDAPMDPVRVARIGRQIAEGLGAAHAHGLVHQDLKPSNVLVARDADGRDVAKVADFGLAARSSEDPAVPAESLEGTPSYMSPEQLRGLPLDARSDLYAVGAILYACLAGRPPFQDEDPLRILWGHLRSPPPPVHRTCPSAPWAPGLETILLRCLAKPPADRPPDARALGAALADWEAAEAGSRGPGLRAPP